MYREGLAGDQHSFALLRNMYLLSVYYTSGPTWTEDTAATGTGNPVRGIVDGMPVDTSNDQGGDGKGQRTEQGMQIFCFLF